jgi:tetratricopeptide (TPR) repeat protein
MRRYFSILLLLASLPAYAQKGKAKPCSAVVTDIDKSIGETDWVEAQASLEQALETQDDQNCRRKLLALGQRLSYVQGQYRSAADRWEKDAVAFAPVSNTVAAIPYPENTGYLFAGLNIVHAGRWVDGGALVTIGLKNTNYNMLRLMKLEDADMHYLLAALGAGMDTMSAMAEPLIPQVMSKWESAGNKLSLLPDTSGANYYLGRVLVEYRKWAAAVPFLQQELGKGRKHLRATEYLLAKCYNELGQYNKAVDLLKPLYEQDKSDWVTAELERAFNGADGRK